MTNRAARPGNGSCRLCLRDLFQWAHGESPYCDACRDLLRRHPGQDPAAIPNGRTERLPQERPSDPRWARQSARARCHGAPIELFEPRPISDEVLPDEVLPDEILQAAAVFCAHCPILELCRAEADAHQFLGLWGGQWRRYMSRGRYAARDLIKERRTAA